MTWTRRQVTYYPQVQKFTRFMRADNKTPSSIFINKSIFLRRHTTNISIFFHYRYYFLLLFNYADYFYFSTPFQNKKNKIISHILIGKHIHLTTNLIHYENKIIYMYFSWFYQENALKIMHFSSYYRHFSYSKNSILIV